MQTHKELTPRVSSPPARRTSCLREQRQLLHHCTPQASQRYRSLALELLERYLALPLAVRCVSRSRIHSYISVALRQQNLYALRGLRCIFHNEQAAECVRMHNVK